MNNLQTPEQFDDIKSGDVLICSIDEWRDGKPFNFDCHVLMKLNGGFDVVYLSGFRSRNDFVPYKDIIAKVDLTMPIVDIDGFSGHFKVFNHGE